MKVTTVFAIAALCLSSSGLLAGQSQEESAAVEKHITTTLHQMYEAEKRRDLKFVLVNFAEDFTEVAGDGGLYRLADVTAGWDDVLLRDYTLSDCLFKLMTKDVAYLSCKMEVDAVYKGQPLPRHFRVTTVWNRQKGRWLIRFEQGTVIPEPMQKE